MTDAAERPRAADPVRAIELLFVDVLRALADAKAPGVEVGIEPDFVWGHIGIPITPVNRVMGARFTAGSADERIHAALAPFRARRLPVSWWVAVTSTPPDLRERLVAYGLEEDDSEGTPGMAIDLASVPPVPELDGTHVAAVRDVRHQAAALDVVLRGFDLPHEYAVPFHDVFGRVPLGDDSPVTTFLAVLDDRPASTALVYHGGEVAGIYNVATVPEARGRGLGGAVTVAALHEARRRGASLAVLESSSMGYPVYRRLGFRDVARFAYLVGRFG